MSAASSVPDAAPGARSELWRALAWLLLLPLVLVGPSLLPGQRFLPLAPVMFEPLASENPAAAAEARVAVDFLASDALFPMLTDAREMREDLRRGELPLWSPTTALGAPLFAQTMFGALYPPHWLAFVLEPDAALGWIALFDLVLAGLGLYLFVRRLGVSFGAALVGAAVFQTAGFASANLHDAMKVEAGLWLPWILCALERLARGERRALPWLAACVALAFLAGFAPIAAFVLVAALAYVLARARNAQTTIPFLARACLGLVLGLALAAVQLLPAADALAQSTRAARLDPIHADDGVALAANLTLVAPEVFGRADEAVFAPANAGVWWLARSEERELAANANLLEWNSFAGSLALALALAAVLARPRAALFPALLALLALGFAQGWPGIAWLRAVPGLDVGSPARAGVLAWTAWAWLASLGADALIARERRAVLGALAACAGFAVLGACLALRVEPDAWVQRLPDALAARFGVTRAFVESLLDPAELARAAARARDSGRWLALFATLGALATGWIAVARGKPARFAWLCLFALAAVEGGAYARPHLAARAVSGPLFPPSAAMDAVRMAAGDGRVLRLDESESGIGDVLDLARPNLPQAYGVADLSPYVVFTPRRAAELWSAADPRAVWRNGVSRISDPRFFDHPVLDVLRVTAILARRPVDHPRLEPILVREGFCVYKRRGVPARARVVTSTIASTGLAGPLEIHAARQADPARQTVLPVGAPPWNDLGDPARGSVELEALSNGAVTVSTHDTPRGWLVLADAWAPGWRATVDGRGAPVLAVDHALRGVLLEAGSHEVAFTYAPVSLRLGALVSAVALAVAILLAWRARTGARST